MIISPLIRSCDLYWPGTKRFLQDLVEINSLTTHREGVARVGERVAAQFGPLGFTPTYLPHPSPAYGDHLILRRPSIAGLPTVALIAHLDTVFSAEEETRNDFHWREEGTRIYGPGTNDIKGGIALIFLMLAALRDSAPEHFHSTNWVVLCNACEETDSEDFGKVCREQLPADTRACLLFEADGALDDTFSLVTSRKGRATFRVDVQGRGAHAGGRHFRGANAITQLSRLVETLESLTNHTRDLTVNVGTISGGTVLNRVPETATASLEMRAFSVAAYEEAKDRILSLSGEGDLRSLDPNDPYACHIEVTLLDETQPWPSNPGSESLAALWESAGRDLDRSVALKPRGGLSDGNVLWNHFPTLDGLGPQGDFAHCSERDPATGKEQEYVETRTFIPKTLLNLLALQKLLCWDA